MQPFGLMGSTTVDAMPIKGGGAGLSLLSSGWLTFVQIQAAASPCDNRLGAEPAVGAGFVGRCHGPGDVAHLIVWSQEAKVWSCAFTSPATCEPAWGFRLGSEYPHPREEADLEQNAELMVNTVESILRG